MALSRPARLGLVLGAVAALPLVPIAVLSLAFPRAVPIPAGTVTPTPELLKRGEYLVTHVTVCTDCHSERDWGQFAGPVKPGSHGKGGEAFPKDKGFPGDFYAGNITPAALGTWSDGELRRAFTAGLTKDNRPLFPIMPWPAYATLCGPDQDAIIAYVRTLKPITNEVPVSQPVFPFSLILRTMPKAPPPAGACPDAANEVARGAYLAKVAACQDCHTPQVKGKPIAGKDWAGGFAMALASGGTARTANITPDPETGIGRWTKEVFIAKFRSLATTKPTAKGERNTVMPWTAYAGMTDDDLGAIYAYLRTVPAVSNKVETFSP